MCTSGRLEPGLKLHFVQLGSRSNDMSQWFPHYVLRHAWLAPSPPPRGVNVVEIALPLLPTGGWAAGVYQSSYLSPCSGWWPFARVEWPSGLPSPGHTLTPPN